MESAGDRWLGEKVRVGEVGESVVLVRVMGDGDGGFGEVAPMYEWEENTVRSFRMEREGVRRWVGIVVVFRPLCFGCSECRSLN
jgi:hypothetical protein